jgi:microcystin-dependent protein
MSNTTSTPYMNLTLPIPGLEIGPQYAIENNTAFSTIDQHTHIPGQGLPVPTAGLNINADLPFNGYNQISIRSSRYNSQIAPLAIATDLNCLYVSGGNLFFNDAVGNQIQMTLSGAVDTSSSGNITGMGSTTASVVYTNINKFFSFYSNVLTPAPLYIGPLTLGTNTASPSTITITPSLTISSPYTITLPDTLPSEQSVVSIDAIGVQTNVAPDNKTMAFSGGKLVAYLPPGMITPFGGTAAPTGWLLCNGTAVSRTTFADLFAVIGTSYGYGDGVSSFNLPDGRGMFLRGVSGASGNDPDAASRTAYTTGGASGNNVGSYQTSTFGSHTHSQNSHNHTQDSHNHSQNAHDHETNRTDSTQAPWGHGSTIGGVSGGTADTNPSVLTSPTTATNNATTATNQATTATNNNTGGNETRPVNIYVNYLIKT